MSAGNGKVTVIDNSGVIRKQLPDAVRAALTAIGLQAERYAKEYLTNSDAVDTGFLRNSVTFAVSGESANISSYSADRAKGSNGKRTGSYSGIAPEYPGRRMAVYVGTNVEYANAVENGTTRMHARPFIKPAAVNHTAEYIKIIVDTLRNS